MQSTGSEIAFTFSVFDDHILVKRLITQIRSFYPEASLFCTSDGTDDLSFKSFAAEFNVSYVVGDRLKQAIFGGAWLERLLSASLQSNAKTIIRTEGDTFFWRKFKEFPDALVAGTLNARHGFLFPRGGCVYFKREVIEQIIESNILKDDCYKQDKFSYLRYANFRYSTEVYSQESISLSDLILGDALFKLGIKVEPWNDVKILFRGNPGGNLGMEFAATHPHR